MVSKITDVYPTCTSEEIKPRDHVISSRVHGSEDG